jgi:large subunit ribosomal protein L9
MQVILTQDVEKLGGAGDIVNVKAGYGRNFLLPRGYALVASRGNVARLEHHQRAIAKRQAERKEGDLTVVKQLARVSVSIARKAGEDDKMFGSVSTRDIADALADQNIKVDRRVIRLREPLRSLGQHPVDIRFSADVTCEIMVNVVAIR